MYLSPVFVIYLATCAVGAPLGLVPRSSYGEAESLFTRGFPFSLITKAIPTVLKTTETLVPKLTKVPIPKPPPPVSKPPPIVSKPPPPVYKPPPPVSKPPPPVSKPPTPVSPSKLKTMLHVGSPPPRTPPKTMKKETNTHSNAGPGVPGPEPRQPTTAHPPKPTGHPSTHSNNGGTRSGSHPEHDPTDPNHRQHPGVSQQNHLGPSGTHSRTSTHRVDSPRAPTAPEFHHHEHDRPHRDVFQGVGPGTHHVGGGGLLGHEIRHELAVEHRLEHRVNEMRRDAGFGGMGAGLHRHDGFRPLGYEGAHYGGWGGRRLY